MIKPITRLVFISIITLFITACGGGGGGSSSSTGDVTTPPSTPSNPTPPTEPPPPATPEPPTVPAFTPVDITLSWNISTTRENGEALAPNELCGYQIFYYKDGSDASDCCSLEINNPQTTSTQIQISEAGTYHFAIAAFDCNQLFSQTSSPITATF